MPLNSEWAISFKVNLGNDSYGGNTTGVLSRLIGIYSDSSISLITPDFYFKDSTDSWGSPGTLTVEGGSKITANTELELAQCFIVKVGDLVYFTAQIAGSRNISSVFNINNLTFHNSNVGFVVATCKSNPKSQSQKLGLVSNIKYYIFP